MNLPVHCLGGTGGSACRAVFSRLLSQRSCCTSTHFGSGTLACVLLILVLAAPLPAAKKKTFELRGNIAPAPGPAVVMLSGATSPFIARTIADSNGDFKFRKLDPAAYKVWVFAPGEGEVEQTVEVGPSTADKKRRVAVSIPFTSPAITSLAQRHKVSVRDLSIPPEAKLDFVEARRLFGRKDTDGAIRRLEHAVQIAPQFAAAWNELGTTAYLTERYAEAEGYFRKALENDPGSFQAIVNLGGVLLNLKRPDEALKYNTFALGDRPKDALANTQMGLNYYFLGDFDAAIPYLREAKSRDPAHFSFPQLYLADIYVRRGAKQAAILELEDFLVRHPDAKDAPLARERLEQLRAK